MKVVSVPDRWYKGLRVACQFCGAISEFEGKNDELQTAERGDMKDEGTVRWYCPNCGEPTTTQPSRLAEDSKRLKK